MLGQPRGGTMQYRRISADCHLDLPWMPPDLFAAEAPQAMKERMPFIVDWPDGPRWTAKNGATFGLVNGGGPSRQKFVPGSHARVDVIAATLPYADSRQRIRRLTSPHSR